MTNQGSLISALVAALGAGYESTPYNVDPVVDGVSLTGAARWRARDYSQRSTSKRHRNDY